jgi:adenylosuccinate synthase
MRAHAIIGAGFGDEGKGWWTDALAARAVAQGRGQPWVVRFNSGAQAGHTVQTPEGRRHVFHQVGSGAFVGAGTYLGPDVALHPMLLAPELEELAALGVHPEMAMHPAAPVTVPYDLLINQAAEAARGGQRHGSCGVGFGETIERHLRAEFRVTARDLADGPALRRVLARIQADHVPARMQALGLPLSAIAPWHTDSGIVERFVRDAQAMASRVAVRDPTFLRHRTAVIFEGAQGLRLDQDLGVFPHVTRSCTGLPHLLTLAGEVGLAEVAVTYVTRAYLTRHGAGPLPEEWATCPAPAFADATNVPNAHQGALRFAALDVPVLRRFIRADQARAQGSIGVTYGLAMNALDQMGPTTPVRGGAWVRTAHLAQIVGEEVGARWIREAWGPTREHERLAAPADGMVA